MSMRKLGTTLLRTRAPIRVVSGFLFLMAALSFACFGQAQPAAAAPADASKTNAAPAQNASGSAQPAHQGQLPPEALGQSTNPPPPTPIIEAPPAPAPSAAQPGQPPQPGQGRAPTATNEGIYVFTAEAREVILHATVVDEKNRLVMDLTKPDFTIYENNQPQTVQLFRREDFPVAMGILIDNSGSMREKRDEFNKAA